jgi:hypothetical protein
MLLMLLGVATAAPAQVNIGINISLFPELVRVPEYPVYYAPRQQANYFFYDGMYWVFQNDEWYSSDWYNGPWYQVEPAYVPVYVLRIPVRYYRRPPAYFSGWQRNAPPRWGQHWGREWEQRRVGWDRWNRGAAPAPAPLPAYQRKYSGDRYPRMEQQHEINNRNYNYRPKDALVREHVRPQIEAVRAKAAPQRQAEPQRNEGRRDARERNANDGGDRNNSRDRGPKDVRAADAKDGRDRDAKGARDRAQQPVPAAVPPPRAEPAAQPRAQSAPAREAEPPRRDAGRDGERGQSPRPSSQPVPAPQPPQQAPAAQREQPRQSQRQDSSPSFKGAERAGQGRDSEADKGGDQRSRDKGGERK